MIRIERIPRLNFFVFITMILLIPLLITFESWKFAKKNIHETTDIKFEYLVKESEKALLYRMESYKQALLGGKGFFQGSDSVDRLNWKVYVSANDVLNNFPGINGIGAIYPVSKNDLESFQEKSREDFYPKFTVHPSGDYPEYFIIKYIEPVEINLEAVGLNIGFETNRREAAILSRDTGNPAITKRILLVQDSEKTPGFLFLLPLYDSTAPLNTVEERRGAFKYWVYAPFIGKNFMNKLTESQGNMLHFQVYDGIEERSEALIYDSNKTLKNGFVPKFLIKKNIEIMQQNWLLVWSSTPEFERLEKSQEPLLVLISGLLFTGLVALTVLILIIRVGTEQTLSCKSCFVPVFSFLVTVFGGYLLHSEIVRREYSLIGRATNEAGSLISNSIHQKVVGRISAMERMADRWNARGGTPFREWKRDAGRYVRDQYGLKAVKWVDNTYQVKWVEPDVDNHLSIEKIMISREQREGVLKTALEKNVTAIDLSVDIAKEFVSYSPLEINNNPDGFVVGVFDVSDLLEASLSGVNKNNFAIRLAYKNKVFYDSVKFDTPEYDRWSVEKDIIFNDVHWVLKVYPTPAFVEAGTSFLSDLILSISLVLGLMVALIIYSAKLSRLKSRLLEQKEVLLSTFVEHVPAAVAMFDKNVNYIAASNRWCSDYNLKKVGVVGKNFFDFVPEVFKNHSEWIDIHKRAMAGELIKVDESSFVNQSGVVEWLRYELRPWLDDVGKIGGLIMFTENITERKRMEIMKDEFISTVNHELRTPLTSIQVSLGILKALAMEALDAEGQRVLTLAYDNCERLTYLVNDILDMEKIAAGKMVYTMEVVEICQLVKDVIALQQSYASRYKVTFSVNCEVEQVYCNIDSSRFNQALVNLISNASKFSPEDETVTITVKMRDAKYLEVSVADNGCGIPESFKEKIFGKFSQADSSSTRAKGGSGLGLNITKSIIEAFGGQVTFVSVEGKGTTFSFILPVVDVKQNEEEHVIWGKTGSAR